MAVSDSEVLRVIITIRNRILSSEKDGSSRFIWTAFSDNKFHQKYRMLQKREFSDENKKSASVIVLDDFFNSIERRDYKLCRKLILHIVFC